MVYTTKILASCDNENNEVSFMTGDLALIGLLSNELRTSI
jgi:hypothetical protein